MAISHFEKTSWQKKLLGNFLIFEKKRGFVIINLGYFRLKLTTMNDFYAKNSTKD